jgi:AcrR family transcriptional regulator
VEYGYAAFSTDRVAKRAGVHRGTLYRHWPGRRALVLSVAEEWHTERLVIPDTGAWPTDAHALCRAVADVYQQPPMLALLRTLIAAAVTDPPLHQALYAMVESRSDHMLEPIRRAKERGDLADTADEGHILELLVSPIVNRCVVTNRGIDQDFLDWTASMVLAATVR